MTSELSIKCCKKLARHGMFSLGSHKKFGTTGVQGWNGKKRGPKGDINRIPENSECPVEEL